MTFLLTWTLASICSMLFRETPMWQVEPVGFRRGLLLLSLPGIVVGWAMFACWTAIASMYLTTVQAIKNFVQAWKGEEPKE